MKFDVAVGLINERKRTPPTQDELARRWAKEKESHTEHGQKGRYHDDKGYSDRPNYAAHWDRLLRSQAEEGDKLSQSRLDQSRKSLRLGNKARIVAGMNAVEHGGDAKAAEDFRNHVNNFLHSNVGKSFDVNDTDIKNMVNVIKGDAVSSDYKQRWNHIMLTSLADKTYKQSAEENNITGQTKDALKGNNNVTYADQEGQMGREGYVIVGYTAYNKINEWLKDHNQPLMPPLTKNVTTIAPAALAKKAKVSTIGKASDFWIEDPVNGRLFVTFKSVENQGGNQGGQINDVTTTLGAFLSNWDEKNEIKKEGPHAGEKFTATKSIAVIRGAEAQKQLQYMGNGVVKWKKMEFHPLRFQTSTGGYIQIPRVLTEGRWLYFLKVLGSSLFRNLKMKENV